MNKRKKIVVFAFGTFLLSGLLLIQSCQKEEVTETKKSDLKTFAEPKQLISNDFAKQLTQNYSDNRETVLKGSGEVDANAVWYSIQELENYINYIKTEGKEKGYNVDGIRLYYGVYPENYNDSDKAGLTTIFLSPTGNKTSSQNFKFIEDSHPDITSLNAMNFGGMGNPPKIDYPSEN